VRVGQIWAGAGWGAFALPRIGHEVIVQFLEGDPDRPLVTGSVYNVDNKTPYELPAQNTRSGIKTHSTKGGTAENFNELRFDDKKGAELLSMQAERDHHLLVKNDQIVTVRGMTTEVHQKSRKTTVTDADTTVVQKGNKNIKAENGQANILAKQVHIKATDSIRIDIGSFGVLIDQMGNVTMVGSAINLNPPTGMPPAPPEPKPAPDLPEPSERGSKMA
jgi:type VI secretion system secreted protein VgrG